MTSKNQDLSQKEALRAFVGLATLLETIKEANLGENNRSLIDEVGKQSDFLKKMATDLTKNRGWINPLRPDCDSDDNPLELFSVNLETLRVKGASGKALRKTRERLQKE